MSKIAPEIEKQIDHLYSTAHELNDGLFAVAGQRTLIEMTGLRIDDNNDYYHIVEVKKIPDDSDWVDSFCNPSYVTRGIFNEQESMYTPFSEDVAKFIFKNDESAAHQKYAELVREYNHF